MSQPRSPTTLWVGQRGTFWVILASTLGLLLLYRGMRNHYRAMSRIADRLESSPDVLSRELDSLRVADTLLELSA